ncbi:hypothetical protein K435DRAFT_659406 [Dendrothele bispora CBS 962.96]|uniref:Uncharacterized protein n=1 Tax=Dendrothele bispora (strain CBS 962.96) TaxID=1314807 RepID=A0A4S8M9Y8_DENBC|nr:hypothetical protein K435DRAFT_659406 [Dendrothele bispora CBS 962.96]
MASPIPEDLAFYLSLELTVVYPIATLSAMFFVYGIYVLLFGTYLYMILGGRGQRLSGTTAAFKLYLGLTSALFILSTVFAAGYAVIYVNDSVMFFNTVKSGDYQAVIRYLDPGENLKRSFIVIPDLSQIHRCYTIWDSDKRIGIPLATASIAMNALGLTTNIKHFIGLKKMRGQLYHLGDNSNFVYYVGSVSTNVILTLLTGMFESFYVSVTLFTRSLRTYSHYVLYVLIAGRIWWIHRRVSIHGVHASDRLVHSVCRIILESGMLYPIFQIANAIENSAGDPSTIPFDFLPVAALMAGVAPTLIMVRAKLGKNVESLQTGDTTSTGFDFGTRSGTVSSIRFGDRLGTMTTTPGVMRPVRSHNIPLAEISVVAAGDEVEEEGKTSK